VIIPVTVRTADRQGNPVPAGTVVTFVTNSGTMSPGSCSTDATSACTVNYITSGTKPTDGVVTVLAYLPGEESFSDLNGNNVWDPGEPFQDMGQAFRDDNHNLAYDSGVDQAIGTAVAGATSACPAVTGFGSAAYPSIANTCDNTWTSAILVRKSTRIFLSSSELDVLYVPASTTNTMAEFTVQDHNTSGPVPFGTTITVTVASNPAPVGTPPVTPPACALTGFTPSSVADTASPTKVTVNLNGVAACTSGVTTVTVTATPPAGSGGTPGSLAQLLP
jgi:hypothetical protein